MASQKWESLTLEEQLVLITRDIEDLLREINSLTAPGGEVDEALNAALDSFVPMIAAYKIDDFDDPSEDEKAENVNLENSPRQHNRQNVSTIKNTSNESSSDSSERSNSRKGRGMSSNRSKTRNSEGKFVKPESPEHNSRGRVVRKSHVRSTNESVDDSVYESFSPYADFRQSNQEEGNESKVI